MLSGFVSLFYAIIEHLLHLQTVTSRQSDVCQTYTYYAKPFKYVAAVNKTTSTANLPKVY